MANTYELISSSVVGATAVSSVTFSSIPQTYTDLVLKISSRSNRASIATAPMRLYPNGSSTGATLRYFQGNGASTVSGTQSVFNAFIGETNASSTPTSTFSNFEIYIPNYTSTTVNKPMSIDGVQVHNSSTAHQHFSAFLWSNTAAITSLEIVDGLASFVQYSSFYLYGIKNA